MKVTLMQADLEFEYPQKLEKLLVKSDMLKWLDEEEEKLKYIASTLARERRLMERGEVIEYYRGLTYDEYYGNSDLS